MARCHGIRRRGYGHGDSTPWVSARKRRSAMTGFPSWRRRNFVVRGRRLSAPGVRLPDVFDPEWLRLGRRASARKFAPRSATCRELIGWVTDDRCEWAPPSASGRPSLLQICLSLEPGFPAYHAAWEFVLALHGGRLEALAHAWNAPVPNKEVVRELTRAEEGLERVATCAMKRVGRGNLRVVILPPRRRRLRAADRNHLVLGCRLRGWREPRSWRSAPIRRRCRDATLE